MSSVIFDIYDTIAAFDLDNIKVVRNIDEVKLSVRESDLPMRILLPSTEGDINILGLDNNILTVDWQIRDLCLWTPRLAGAGIEQYAEDMVTYIKDYIDLLKTNRNPGSNSVITGVNIVMLPLPWGENDYWAIDIALTIKEII